MKKLLSLSVFVILCCLSFNGCNESPSNTSHDQLISESKIDPNSSESVSFETVSEQSTILSVDEEESSDELHMHIWNEWITTKMPTCTEAGTEERFCDCGEVESEVISELGHKETIDKEIAATCTTNGKTEGKHCLVCNEIIEPQKTTLKLGHTEVIDYAISATCTKPGKTEGSHCSVCNAIIKEQEILPALSHTEVVDPAVDATCTKTGLTQGSHCSVCDSVIIKQNVIEKTPHNYIEEFIPKNEATNAYIIYKCNGCQDSYTKDVEPITAKITKSTGIMLVNGVRYNSCLTVSDIAGGYGESYTVTSSAGLILQTSDFEFNGSELIAKSVTNIYFISAPNKLIITITDKYGNSVEYVY